MRPKQFLTALAWVAYETGLRPSDLRELEWKHINFELATIQLAQRKTGKPHTAIIGPESIESLKTLKAYDAVRVFPLNKHGVWRWEQLLYKRAEVFGFTRQKRQGIGTLRKTHATEVFKAFGLAAAAQSLGHSGDTTTARRHYIDSSTQRGYLPRGPEKRA